MTIPRFAIGSFTRGAEAAVPGVLVQGQVTLLRDIPGLEWRSDGTCLDLFENWERLLPAMNDWSAAPDIVLEAAAPLDGFTPDLPLQPRQIVCAGANYRRHVIEMMADHDVGSEAGLDPAERRRRAERLMDHRAAHGRPFAFVKPVSTLLPPGQPLVIPPDSAEVDWEIELAAVIGRPCYRVPRERALDFVAGYTIANDISARDRLSRRDFPNLGLDFIAGKSAPGFLPLGPFIVPSSLVPDPQNLMMTLTLNGEIMQQESTADMIFPLAQLIEHISTYMRLLPGDVVCTGSPAGNGTHYGRYLRPGDVMEARIDGFGVQRLRCIAETVKDNAARHTPFGPLPQLAEA